MIPAAFEYERAESAAHAVELLGRGDGEAKLLAGGHSLLPLMKLRVLRPSLLVDVGRVAELAYVRDGGDHVAVGAGTRHAVLERDALLRAHCGIVPHAASLVGDPQVRHRGTLGGALAHGDPAGDLPAVALALDAELTALGPAGTRTIAAREFFLGPFTTALAPDEVLTEVRFPKLRPGEQWSYRKLNRRALDWATVAAAVVVVRGEDGRVREPRVALASMGPAPLRASAVERELEGSGADGVAAAAERAADDADPPGDTSASPELRRHLARVLVRRGLEEALAR
jgi:aerobic carbon-monoxide dehydrogenase medium subunit